MKAFFELSRENDKLLYCKENENDNCNPHFHANIEVNFVLKGEMEASINGNTQVITEGCVSVADSYDTHYYQTPKNSKSLLLVIPADISLNILPKDTTFASPFMNACPRSKTIADAIYKLLEFNGSKDSMIAKGYIYVVIGCLIEQIGLKSRNLGSNSADLIRNILIYLEKNYLNDLTVKDLATHFGYHKDYLSRLINSKLGCGFNYYLNFLRARHAAALIRETNQSLTEISYQSGFQSFRTFNRAFQSFYEVTPYEYKRQCRPHSDADMEVKKALHNID
ncbi:MAG TPA: AraC family transcriptional regulator [Clostridiales bacterium]|nr:AraC family transcriptional regulator [Clostridiales bacterium]